MIDRQHFIELANHAAGQTVTPDSMALGFSDLADLQRALAGLGSEPGERDFQNFLRYARACSKDRSAEFEWQKETVVYEWGYPRGVFCVAADNGRPFVDCDDELAALVGL